MLQLRQILKVTAEENATIELTEYASIRYINTVRQDEAGQFSLFVWFCGNIPTVQASKCLFSLEWYDEDVKTIQRNQF
jgi:hypothetical protein